MLIRKSTLDNLQLYVFDGLKFNHSNYEIIEVDDNHQNPLCSLRVDDWNLLYEILIDVIAEHNTDFTDETSEVDLVIGSFIGLSIELKHKIERQP